ELGTRHGEQREQAVRDEQLVAVTAVEQTVYERARRHEIDGVALEPHAAAEQVRAAMKLAVLEPAVPNAFDEPRRPTLDGVAVENGQSPGAAVERRNPAELRQRIASHISDRGLR